jgi:hypothetical protein
MHNEDFETIAHAYHAAPDIAKTESAARGYHVLGAYVLDESARLTREGWRAVPIEDDTFLPDLRTCAILRGVPILDTCHDHPLLSDRENYAFRFVHDVTGHIHGGAWGFSFDDERVAYQTQRAALERWCDERGYGRHAVDLASRFLYTEVVGQAAYFHTFGRFPGQKVALLW